MSRFFTKLSSFILNNHYYEFESLWLNKGQKSSVSYIKTEETQAFMNEVGELFCVFYAVN
jgi:hypothetical protein